MTLAVTHLTSWRWGFRWFVLLSCSRWWSWLWRGVLWSYPGSPSMQTPAPVPLITAAVPQAARKGWTAVCPAIHQKTQAEMFPKNTASSPRVGCGQPHLRLGLIDWETLLPPAARASSSCWLELHFLVSIAEVLGLLWHGSSRRLT